MIEWTVKASVQPVEAMLIAQRAATNASGEVLGLMDRTPVTTARAANFMIGWRGRRLNP
jgi:hypothetical protein